MANEDRFDRIERSLEKIVSALGAAGGGTSSGEMSKEVQDAAGTFLRDLDLKSAQRYLGELERSLPGTGPGAVATTTVTVTVTITITVKAGRPNEPQ